MPTRCVVGGCSNTKETAEVSLHWFPKDKKTLRGWNQFLSFTRKDWKGPSDTSVVCSAHFQPNDFTNYLRWKMGYADRLTFINKGVGIIPSVFPPRDKREGRPVARPVSILSNPAPSPAASSSQSADETPASVSSAATISPTSSTASLGCMPRRTLSEARQTEPPRKSRALGKLTVDRVSYYLFSRLILTQQ
jgi:hypothetical protein